MLARRLWKTRRAPKFGKESPPLDLKSAPTSCVHPSLSYFDGLRGKLPFSLPKNHYNTLAGLHILATCSQCAYPPLNPTPRSLYDQGGGLLTYTLLQRWADDNISRRPRPCILYCRVQFNGREAEAPANSFELAVCFRYSVIKHKWNC